MNERKFLALLLALTLVRGLIYAAVVLPWQAPDEIYHFLSTQLPGLAVDPTPDSTWDRLEHEMLSSLVEFHFWDMNTHMLPVRGPEEAPRDLPSDRGSLERSKPRSFVYHLLSVGLMPVGHQGVNFQLYWARFLSVLINVCIVAVAYATARLLFGNDPFGTVLLPLSIVFLPLHTYILSVVNDGNPAELFASLAICFWVWGLTRGWHWYKMTGMGLFAVLAIGAKPATFYLVLAIPAWVILHYRRRLVKVVDLIPVLAAIGLVVGATFLLKRLQNDILTGWQAIQGFLQGQPLQGSETLGQGMFETIRAFWAQMAWTSILLSDVWGNWLVVFSLLAGLGVLKFVFMPATRTGDESPGKEVILVLALCVLASLGLVPIYLLVHVEWRQSQSRYFLSAIIPIMALLVIGWRELIPRNWRVEGLALIISLFLLLDTVVLLNYGLPFFYPLWRY